MLHNIIHFMQGVNWFALLTALSLVYSGGIILRYFRKNNKLGYAKYHKGYTQWWELSIALALMFVSELMRKQEFDGELMFNLFILVGALAIALTIRAKISNGLRRLKELHAQGTPEASSEAQQILFSLNKEYPYLMHFVTEDHWEKS